MRLYIFIYERFVINKSSIFGENRTATGMDDEAGGPLYEGILGHKK